MTIQQDELQWAIKCKSNSFMVENCSESSHIQPRQIYDLTDLQEKIWLFGRFEDYRFENCYYFYISRWDTTFPLNNSN